MEWIEIKIPITHESHMRNFLIFLTEKEGTSALVSLLNNFPRISVVHQVENSGWEPFDRHNCGSMSSKDLESCLNRIFGERPLNQRELNEVYTITARKPLNPVDTNDSVGFKMRFEFPNPRFPLSPGGNPWNRVAGYLNRRLFIKMLHRISGRNQVAVFMAVRQDLLRWGLSKYHGDGSGKSKGHLQFKLTSGEIRQEDISRLEVDCERLGKIIRTCRRSNNGKRRIITKLEKKGIEVFPLLYEQFLNDKGSYFQRFFHILGSSHSAQEIEFALSKGTAFRKVHSDDISKFVVNHREVMDRFGSEFDPWSNLD